MDVAAGDGWRWFGKMSLVPVSALTRTIGFSAAGIVTVSLALGIPLALRPSSDTRPVIYAMPQVLALAVIVGVPLGAFFSLGGRVIGRRSAAAVVALAVGCSAVSMAMLNSLVPAANRAAREASGVTGAPAPNEMTLSELRQQRDEATRIGDLERGRSLGVYYHTRWALSCMPLAFIVLALSIVTWREVSRLTLFFVFGLGLAGYAVLVREGMQAGLSGSLPAIIAAWIPNLAFGSLAAAVVSLRRRTWRIGAQES